MYTLPWVLRCLKFCSSLSVCLSETLLSDLKIPYSRDQMPWLQFISSHNLCSFYSRSATNQERRLLNSVVWVKVFCKCKGFEKSQFYKINEELRCGDLVLKQNFQLSLDQSSLSYKAVPTWHLQSVYWRRWIWVAGEWTCSWRLLIIYTMLS